MKKLFISVTFALLILTPGISYAEVITVPVADGTCNNGASNAFWPLVQCGERCSVDGGQTFRQEPVCEFNDFVSTIGRITNFLIVIGVSASAIVFAWAGFLYLSAGGSPEQIKRATGIFTKVMIGFVIMLSAWLIVKFIQDTLVNPEIKNIEEFGG